MIYVISAACRKKANALRFTWFSLNNVVIVNLLFASLIALLPLLSKARQGYYLQVIMDP